MSDTRLWNPKPENDKMKHSKKPRHFLSLLDLSPKEFRALIARACELKVKLRAGKPHSTLQDRTLAMIFSTKLHSRRARSVLLIMSTGITTKPEFMLIEFPVSRCSVLTLPNLP